MDALSEHPRIRYVRTSISPGAVTPDKVRLEFGHQPELPKNILPIESVGS